MPRLGAPHRREGLSRAAQRYSTSMQITGRPLTRLISPSVTKAGRPTPEVNLAADLSDWGVPPIVADPANTVTALPAT